MSQHLDQQRASAAGADDRHRELAEDLLALGSEHQDLPLEAIGGGADRARLRPQRAQVAPDDPQRHEADRLLIRRPDLASDSVLTKDEPGNWPAVCKVNQRWVRVAVCVEVVAAESDALARQRMAVSPKQAEAELVALERGAGDGARDNLTVGAPVGGHEVVIGDRHHLAHQKPAAPLALGEAGVEEGGVLVAVRLEQVPVKALVVALEHCRPPTQPGFLNQSITAMKRELSVSSPVSKRSWLLIRSDICVRWTPSPVSMLVACVGDKTCPFVRPSPGSQ